MVWCTVGANVVPKVVKLRDRWKLRRADYDSFRRDLFEMPRPEESFAKDMRSLAELLNALTVSSVDAFKRRLVSLFEIPEDV